MIIQRHGCCFKPSSHVLIAFYRSSATLHMLAVMHGGDATNHAAEAIVAIYKLATAAPRAAMQLRVSAGQGNC